jgi:hypothetical protein
MSTTSGSAGNSAARATRSHTHETKAFYKTSEFILYVVVSLAVLIAAAVVDNGEDGQGFGAAQAWSYVALLTVGYMISRGLSKAGTHHRDND